MLITSNIVYLSCIQEAVVRDLSRSEPLPLILRLKATQSKNINQQQKNLTFRISSPMIRMAAVGAAVELCLSADMAALLSCAVSLLTRTPALLKLGKEKLGRNV